MPASYGLFMVDRDASLTPQIVARTPIDSGGNSGNTIERVTLVDGRVLVLKRVSPDWDWLSRATKDDGRIATMWEHGLFDRMPASIDHATVTVERDGAGWNVFMRDVSHTLLSDETRHDRRSVRRLLEKVADLHAVFWDQDLPNLCSIEDRYGMLSPQTGQREKALGNPAGSLILRAWDAFYEHAPREIADVIAVLVEDPTPIADELRTCTQTLIHGDLRLGNAGFDGDRLVLIDWGDRTGIAPPAVDLAWFIGFDAQRLDISPDDVVTEFRALYADRFEERALHLSLIGGLVHLGAHLGLKLISADDDARSAGAKTELLWWTRNVARALEMWSPDPQRERHERPRQNPAP
jgi:aminoglycoside phosphotransferase (APT) family kinase protein